MNYFVFQVSDQSAYGKQRVAKDTFDFLVRDRSVWGFGFNTPNRKAIDIGDKVLFYLTGMNNQVFVGTATLKSKPYQDKSKESKDWFLDSETLRIDLEDVSIFDQPKPRKNFKSIEWRPMQGGSSKISEHDYGVIVGTVPDVLVSEEIGDEEMEFALEKYLEDFMVDNWEKIDFGEKLKIFEDSDGNIGKQYYTKNLDTKSSGYIDILARTNSNDFLVIELKKGKKNDEVVGQVLRYMQWVKENLAKKNEKVRGLIIVRDKDRNLELAVKQVEDKVVVKRYKINFNLVNY